MKVRTKRRLSASIDAELVAAAESAVRKGLAASVSAWVSEAMERQLEHDRRMQALGEFLRAYEAEHGVISQREIDEAGRWARERAVVVRGLARPKPTPAPRRRSA